MKLIFATNNQNKVKEIKWALPSNYEIITLEEAGIVIDIPEPYDTLEENAAGKARTIYNMTAANCFSEDTGLEVVGLNGAPGVRSARYAGDKKSPAENMSLLLSNLENKKDRRAQFRTVICLIFEKEEHYFEGVCQGSIGLKPKGAAGFGYDPIFIPDGAVKTFAEMDLQEKNHFSHRKKASDMLVTFLNESS